MCHDVDSHPPIAPIAGGALDSSELTLTSADGNRFAAFRARAARPSGAGVVIQPDVRGLHPFYIELALRFAESGIDSIALDQYGRTAGAAQRGAEFDYMPNASKVTYDGLTADIRAGATALREPGPGRGAPRSLFVVGFCAGGRVAFDAATMGLDCAGVIGFYGFPGRWTRNDVPAPMDMAGQMECPVLGLFGGADQGIPASAVEEFETALSGASVEHRIVTYPDAPHSFFDRSAEDHASAAADAWQRVIEFIDSGTPSAA